MTVEFGIYHAIFDAEELTEPKGNVSQMSHRNVNQALKPLIFVLIFIALMIPLPVAAQSADANTKQGIVAEGPTTPMWFIPMVQANTVHADNTTCPILQEDGGVLCTGPETLPMPTENEPTEVGITF